MVVVMVQVEDEDAEGVEEGIGIKAVAGEVAPVEVMAGVAVAAEEGGDNARTYWRRRS